MEKSRSFCDVLVWRKAHELVLEVYQMTRQLPREELFGLTSQLRRAAVSVPANFAEGFRKAGKNDKLRFYNISQGSLEECRYYLILIQDLAYANTDDIMLLLDEVARILDSYMCSLRAK